MTTSTSRPSSAASIASRCPGRSSAQPNASRATRSILDSSARAPRVTGMDQPWSGRKLHFVGILGAGMSGLAKVARLLGAEVTGSDRALHGHDAANVPEGAEVVYSSAIAPENPERRPPEMHRADLLGELTRLKPTIAVSGTHGKTTTTSMIVHGMENPSYLVGGEVRSTGTNADWTGGRWLVVEADESDRSLLKLSPAIAVVTNAELDHHTTYASSKDVLETFRAFMQPAPQAVVGEELTDLRPDGVTFGVEHPDLAGGGVRFRFGDHLVELSIPGHHNALNAAAALTVCRL